MIIDHPNDYKHEEEALALKTKENGDMKKMQAASATVSGEASSSNSTEIALEVAKQPSAFRFCPCHHEKEP